MVRFFFFCVFLIFPLLAFSQNSNNYLQVFTNATIKFTIEDPQTIETPQVIPGAYTLRVRTRNKACAVYAKIANYSGPSGFYPLSSPIHLDWVSDTSPDASLASTGDIAIESYDKILFSQPKMSSSPSYYQYNYNLKLAGIDYNWPPGNYNFTILFTMTPN